MKQDTLHGKPSACTYDLPAGIHILSGLEFTSNTRGITMREPIAVVARLNELTTDLNAGGVCE